MKNTLTHLVSVVFLAIISVAYFYPVLSGKSIQQSDISQFNGYVQSKLLIIVKNTMRIRIGWIMLF